MLLRGNTHPYGIVARTEAHFVPEGATGDAAVALRTALCFGLTEPDGGTGHVAQAPQGQARYEVVGVNKRRDQLVRKLT